MSLSYRRITANLTTAKLRYETHNAKRHIVAPAVMLTEGVHAGSEGPLLYLNDELKKNPQTWNHKPVVVYHPTMNGIGISACDPAVIEAQSVGVLFNTAHDSRLKTEAWMDVDKLTLVDNRIHTAILNKEMVEVSTGLFNDIEAKQGVWEPTGEKYVGIVRNIQPDHLALLPDQVGACSILDGAGLLRNAETKIETGLSLDDIRSQVSTLLRENRTTGDKTLCDDYCYVMDVYKAFVIYESNGRNYKVGYKVKGTAVSLVGPKEEVRKVTSYVTANGARDGKILRLPYTWEADKIIFGTEPEEVLLSTAFSTVSNTGTPNMADTPPVIPTPAAAAVASANPAPAPAPVAVPPANEVRRTLVDQLILTGDWKEEDKPSLLAIPSEATFQKIVAASAAKLRPVPQVQNQQAMTMQQFIANAPSEFRDSLTEMATDTANKRAELVKVIVGNAANRFPQAWLEAQPMTTLEGMASLASVQNRQQPPAQQPQGGGYIPGAPPMLLPLQNRQSGPANVPVLDIPVMDFSKS